MALAHPGTPVAMLVTYIVLQPTLEHVLLVFQCSMGEHSMLDDTAALSHETAIERGTHM